MVYKMFVWKDEKVKEKRPGMAHLKKWSVHKLILLLQSLFIIDIFEFQSSSNSECCEID